MIGLDLGGCVIDLIRGDVALADVEYIVAGTCAGSAEEWQEILDYYSGYPWKDFPEEARRLALQLIEEGLVVQSRLENGLSPDVSKGFWIEDASEITYFQDRNFREVRKLEESWRGDHAVLH